MKKITIILLIFIIGIVLQGCSVKKDANRNGVDESISNPDIETIVEPRNDIIYPDGEIIDNYYVYTIDGYKMAAPCNENSNLEIVDLRDVLHMDTSLSLSRQKLFSENNMPDGAEITEKNGLKNGFFWYRQACPEFIWDTYTDKEKNALLKEIQVIKGAFSYLNKSGNGTDSYEYVGNLQDVEIISCALYEKFYNNIPDINIEVYGISNEIFEKYVTSQIIDGKEIYNVDYNQIYLDFISEKCSIDKLIDTDIESSGIYYIDYNELQNITTYKQFMYVLTFNGEIDNEYGYSLISYQYCIDDEKVYKQWKQQHMEQFLK